MSEDDKTENIYNEMMSYIGRHVHNGYKIKAVKLSKNQYAEFLKIYEGYCCGMFWEFHPDGKVDEISYQGHSVKIKVKDD